MSPTHVSHDVVDGDECATAAGSVREGSKVAKEDRACLGRVVDRGQGIYGSRARGLVTYDAANRKTLEREAAARAAQSG